MKINDTEYNLPYHIEAHINNILSQIEAGNEPNVEWICDLYFSVKDDKMNVENPAESHTSLAYTFVWEQICLQCL